MKTHTLQTNTNQMKTEQKGTQQITRTSQITKRLNNCKNKTKKYVPNLHIIIMFWATVPN